MDNVTVDRLELIAKLQENLKVHTQDYKDAHSAWLEQAIEHHKAQVASLEEDGVLLQEGLPRAPENHEKDYNVALQMLEMSVEENVTLENHQFRELVMDEWHWKGNFAASVTRYTGKQFI